MKEGQNIVITALPYQVSPRRCMEQIAEQMRAKKLPWWRTSATNRTTRTRPASCIVPRSQPRRCRAADGAPVRDDRSRKQLRVNLNIIGLDGRPQVRGLKDAVEWLRSASTRSSAA
jgi:topoisomerase IV subunit A